ncbi:MAG: alpha/beta hydrolase family protein, partial [Qipengyuania sp.]
MKISKTYFRSAIAGALALAMAPAALQAQSQPTVPVEVWALRDVVNAVQISPDGKHVLVHKLESKDGEYLLEIYKTEDMSTPFRRLNADPMEIIGAQWVNDNYIFGTAWEQNRKSVKGPEQGT